MAKKPVGVNLYAGMGKICRAYNIGIMCNK